MAERSEQRLVTPEMLAVVEAALRVVFDDPGYNGWEHQERLKDLRAVAGLQARRTDGTQCEVCRKDVERALLVGDGVPGHEVFMCEDCARETAR